MGEYLHREYEIMNDMGRIYKKSEKPKISIIIPIYNVEEYIKTALDSLVNQTLEDIEIIIVNDCTPDNSMNLVRKYAKNDERFVILEQDSNQGQGVARNRALDIATGEYIMFLDPDDWYELNTCEKAYNQISKNQNDIVFFDLYSWKERNGKLCKQNSKSNRLIKLNKYKSNQHINLSEIKENWLTSCVTWCQIYSREFLNINNIRFSNDRFTENIPFFIKAIVCSKDASILNEPLYNYRKKVGKFTVDYPKYYESVFSSKALVRDIIWNSENKEAFIENYILYEIVSDVFALKTFTKMNKTIRKDFYAKMRKKFEQTSIEIPVDILKKSPKYKEFELILKCKTYEEYRFKRVFAKLFK